MPRLDAGDTAQARLLVDAYLAARAAYAGLEGAYETTVRQMPKDEAERARFEKLLADPPLPLEDLEAISGGGLLHKRALIVEPERIVHGLLAGCRTVPGVVPQVDIAARTVNGETFDAIIFANAMAMRETFGWTGLEGRLGQVESLTGAADVAADALASGHYALALNDRRLWGATFEKIGADEVPAVTDAAREANAAALASLSPWWQRDATDFPVTSRASVRATTADRLPLAGAVPDLDRAIETFAGMLKGRPADTDAPVLTGIYMVNGFGARGFTWGPWTGSVLAAQLLGEPAPATQPVLEAVSPMRLITRALRRGEV